MTICLPNPERQSRNGFTLIELLAVIAVIGILMAILIPSVGMVQRSAAKSKTRSQFAQYATAYEAFYGEMGYYPSMGASGSEFALEGHNAVFIETLSGFSADGGNPATPYARKANPRRLRFYTFAESEFGLPGTDVEGELVDGLDNPHIYVVIDRDRDGVIKPADFSALDSALRPANALRGGVFFYSAKTGDNPDWEWILSWE